MSPWFYPCLFALYVANYFVIVFFNVALVGVANSRLVGGTWTFRDGLELAWRARAPSCSGRSLLPRWA